MKELVLKIKHSNWGITMPGSWRYTEWEFYNDLSVDMKISYRTLNEGGVIILDDSSCKKDKERTIVVGDSSCDDNIKTLHTHIEKDMYDKLLKNYN